MFVLDHEHLRGENDFFAFFIFLTPGFNLASTHFISQTGFELVAVLLPQLPRCWGY